MGRGRKPGKKRKSPQRQRAKNGKVALYLFLFFLGTYLFLGQGILTLRVRGDRFVSITTSDEAIRTALTSRIVDTHRLDLDTTEATGRMVPRGREGRAFSYFGIAKSLWNIPFYLLSKVLEHAVPPLRGYHWALESFSNAVLSAILIVALFFFLLELAIPPRYAFFSLLVYGFATMALSHAKYNVLEPLVSLSLVLTLLHALRYGRRGRLRDALLAGFYLGIGVHTRATTVLTAPLVVAYFWLKRPSENTRRVFWRGVLGFLAALAPFLLLQLAYNLYRYGDPLQFGYTLKGDHFLTAPLQILHNAVAMLISPRVGLFVYAPVLLFALKGVRGFLKDHRAEALLLLSTGTLYWLVFAAWWYWFAFYAGGPRFLGQVHFVFLLFLARGLVHWRRWSPWSRRLFWAAVLWGVAVNLLFIWASPRRARYIAQARALTLHQPAPSAVPSISEVWNPLHSHIRVQAQQVADMVIRREIRIVPTPSIRAFFNRPNFWWIHYPALGVSPAWIYLVVSLLWALILGSLARLLRLVGVSAEPQKQR